MATLMEMAEQSSTRSWKQDGPDRLVKVVNSHGAQGVRGYGTIMGYVTQEKYLYGKTSREMEALLGLRPGELKRVAWIFSMVRMPKLGEFEYKFSLAFPDGRVFEEEQWRQAMQARADFRAGKRLYERSHSETAQYYPPGSSMIPQWKITKPIPLAGLVQVVTETLPFQRGSGSTEEHRPHNRGPVR